MLSNPEEQGHKMPHWKAISICKYELRELRCGSTFNICRYVSKSANLLKWGFFDPKTACTCTYIAHALRIDIFKETEMNQFNTC